MHGHCDGFPFFLVPSIPATLANFLIPIMVRRQGSGVSARNLLAGISTLLARSSRCTRSYAAASIRAGTSRALYMQHLSNSYVRRGHGRLHRLASPHPDRLELHRTVHKMRAPGMTWSRLPLFVWANYATG